VTNSAMRRWLLFTDHANGTRRTGLGPEHH
jgi:hypothetical protein